jgi:hypothetical protein
MEYFSDASLNESDDENPDENDELYCPRELDYWAIEELLESRGPPPVIEYVAKLGVVTLREIVVAPSLYTISQVVDAKSVHSWKAFWQKIPIDKTCLFSAEDWDAIGEFCMQLCGCVVPQPSAVHVRSCMLHLLHFGNFRFLNTFV